MCMYMYIFIYQHSLPVSCPDTHAAGPDAEDTEQPPGEAVNTLELVCNSASTTSADYFGSYLPFEGGCRFFYGPLARALRMGTPCASASLESWSADPYWRI